MSMPEKLRLFPPPFVPDAKGFTPESDIFNRKPLADGLTSLLSNVADPLVVAVDGPWGCGKTTFLKTWAKTLEATGYSVIFFDAFEHDYFEDPFLAIAGEIIALAQEKKSADKSRSERLAEKAKSVGKIILRSGLKIGVSVASAGALRAEGFENAAKEFSSELGAVTDKYLGEMLTKAAEQKGAIVDFKQALSDLPTLLSDETTGSKPLIFIVDELDRCRPPFALALLERIKHFLSVPNVHFVFGVHLDQLANAARLTYGADLDAPLYLQKFIHLSVSLSTINNENRGVPDEKRYITHLFSHLYVGDDERVKQLISDSLIQVAKQRGLTFRTLERICTSVSLAMLASRGKIQIAPLIAGLCVLKVLEPALYRRAKSGTLTLKEAKAALGPMDEWEEDWWKFALIEEMTREEAQPFFQSLFRYNLRDRKSLVPFTANTLIDGFSQLALS